MKLTANFVHYLAFCLALHPHTATAFVEPDATAQTDVALASFIDTNALPPPNTAFFQAFDDDVPASFASSLSAVEDRFGLEAGSTRIDGRSGKISSLDLTQPILPGDGAGNNLLWSVGSGYGPPSSMEEWSEVGVKAVENWLLDHQSVLQIDAANELFPSQLFVDISTPSSDINVRSAVHGEDGEMIQVSIQRTFKGVKVVKSRATATIKSGTLINVGLERWGDINEKFNVEPRITEEDAYDAIAIKTGLSLTDEVTCKPELQIITTSQGDLRSRSLRPSDGNKVKAPFGQGYAHILVWRVCPKFEGQGIEKMEGIVDATSGQVLSFQDTVDYLTAKGNVYPFSNDKKDTQGSLQIGWPMPFMQVGTATTTTGGNFDLGGSQTAKLTGPYIEMRDLCGTGYSIGTTPYGIANLAQSNGIDWGGAGGTDCTTPGFGSTSNTHSSRSGFYELNKIIEIARSRLPGNLWLQGKLLSYMNINDNCNAYWDGDVNFYRSGGGCANTGEIAGVFDHEWGHGLDNNDLTMTIAEPSGEGIADLYAALRLNDSCIGRGFFLSGVCSGDGNPCDTCTGVRDIDYKKRRNKTPTTYAWANANCGGSVHCLGYVYSEAVWSLYKRELNSFYGYDENTSLEIVTRLTYIAGGVVSVWYDGNSGCGASSGYLSYLAADDDNSNLSDGTPHMKAIFKAFNDQQIACNTPTVQDSGCAGKPTVSPIVTVVGSDTKATLTWTAVSGASKYQVFRTEGTRQCGQGKVLLATLGNTTLTYSDQGLANGRQYYYIVVPKGEKDPCFGPSSSCAAVTIGGPGVELSCDNNPLIISTLPGQTPATQYRNCAVYGTGGFTGTVNVNCVSSSLSGVSCAVSPSSVTVSSTTTTVILSIQASSVAATGSILVTASSGSLTSSSTVPVTVVAAGGAQVAAFDTSYKAPRCIVFGTECSSGNLLNGRGSMTGGNELNAPNTIGNCLDGNSGTYHVDESIDKIVVRSGYTTGTGAGSIMVKGGRATIIATVYAYGTGSTDYADFYYASDVDPAWKFISTVKPTGGGSREILVDYQLPQANIHMVRVNFRYSGSASSCASGSWTDHDDLVFAVADTVTAPPVTLSPVTSPPTNQPVTMKPTNSPTKKPTKSPITSPPSKKPTSAPTQALVTSKPTNTPTTKPTNSPTQKPTSSPTKAPVTSKPTNSPTTKPTNSPTQKLANPPSTAPTLITVSPTAKPTPTPMNPPSSPPVSSAPTSASNGQQEASFDSTFGAPRCTSVGSACSSASLVDGRGNVSLGAESNPSNTIDGCADGSSGTYHNDESIDKVVVRSGEVDGSGSDVDMVGGGRATIIASVFAWSTGASDTADFFYTSDASSPNWQYIGSITPSAGQQQDLKIAYTLPEGTNQAVRVQFRYQGSIGTCTSGSYDDRDDLVFAVKPGPTQPTQSPVKTSPPTVAAGGGPKQASYDSGLKVPRCSLYGSECDSLTLFNGRGTMSNGNELNMPNTLDACTDGNSGTYHSDESIDKIIVRSGEIDGSGSGVDMAEGGRATIIATVYPWGTGGSDYADFYYARDAFNPLWQYIGTKQPVGGGLQELKMAYTLPIGANQAVRVNFRYRGTQGTNGACSKGYYDDNDDLAFRVKANSLLSWVESVPVVEVPKDTAADVAKRTEINLNESGDRGRGGSKAAKRQGPTSRNNIELP